MRPANNYNIAVNIKSIIILLCIATFLIGILLSSSSSHAASSVTANASVIIPDACTMTGTLDEAHTATIPNGTIRPAIGKTTFNVVCNDPNGFAIYAVGYSNQEYGNTKLLATVGGTLAPTYDIVTGDTTTGNSQWAMMLTPVTTNVAAQNGYGSYSVVPTTYTKIAQFPNSTTVSGEEAEVTYRAYIAGNQPAGTYNGKVKYTMVHPNTETPPQPVPCVAYRICYNANGSNVVGTMGQQTAYSNNAAVTLLASNFSRTGYGFAGWSDKYDYATNPDAHFYGPNETFTTPSTQTTTGTSLYAVWVKSAGSLQSSSDVSALCDTSNGTLIPAPTDGTANLDSVSALTDQRDNQTYAIARLADGKCWMIENLRLDYTNSDNSSGSLAQGYGGQFVGLAIAEPAWANNITTANNLYSTDGANDTVNIGTSNASSRFPRYNNINTSTRSSSPATGTNVAIYSYGNYYTWAATIADTTDYSSGDHDTTSICPTGWKIPLGKTSTGDIEQGASDTANKVPGFSYLDRKMGGTGRDQSAAAASLRWRKYPVNFVYSGYVNSGSVISRGTNGYYWSSTAYSSNSAYYLFLTSSGVYPGTGGYNVYKYSGRTVRCVAGV